MRAPDQQLPDLAARDPRIPAGLGPRRTRILEVALGELAAGVREEPPGSNRGPRIDAYMPAWAMSMPGPPWCAWYATWVLSGALGSHPLGRTGGTSTLTERARARSLWRPRDGGYLPSPGDLFMMRTGPRTGHVGFVLGCRDGEILTIEGNSDDRVRLGQRRLDDARLTGWICTVPEETYAACWWPCDGEDVAGAGTR